MPAQHHEQFFPLEHGRRADAKEGLRNVEILGSVALPDLRARRDVEAGEFPFGAEGEAPGYGEHGGAAWTAVVAVGIGEPCRGGKTPAGFAGFRVEAFHDLLVREAVEKYEPVAQHAGSGVARADFFLPEHGRTLFGPTCQEPGFGGDAVATRAEESRPILAGAAGRGLPEASCRRPQQRRGGHEQKSWQAWAGLCREAQRSRGQLLHRHS